MGHWKMKNLYFNRSGQALLELAVFGSILIMLLGILVNYGLRYNNQVRAMQTAFRQGLKYAAESVKDDTPGSVSYLFLEDKHIPSPSDPFGIGSVIPVSASASVTRNYAAHKTADKIEELPRLAIDIKGGRCPGSRLSPKGSEPPCYYLAAGFREERDVYEDNIEKYTEIYGQEPQACTDLGAGGECVSWEALPERLTEEDDDVLKTCADDEENVDTNGDPICLKWTIDRIRIIDSCAGEVIDYSAALRQCRQIVDKDICVKECERAKGPGSKADCGGLCGKSMGVPWYCANYSKDGSLSHKYTFPVLEGLVGRHKAMGLQQDYMKTTTINNRLEKSEGASGITTTDSLDWKETTTREIIHRDYDDKSGAVMPPGKVVTEVGPKKKFSPQSAGW